MRSILCLILFCLSLLSFSQKGVNTKKFPYQVLFADQVSVFGKEVKQFDYLTNEDHLIVEGSVTIFHYSYRMFELDSGSYRISDLVKGKPRKFNYRPVLDPKGKYKNPISPIPQGTATCPTTGTIEIVVPTNLDNAMYYRNEEVELNWILPKEDDYQGQHLFEIEISNIFDEVVRIITTDDSSIAFRSDTLDADKSDQANLDEGLLVISVKSLNDNDLTTGDFTIRIFHEGESLPESDFDENFIGLRNAIYYDYQNEKRKANFLYIDQLRKSNQDPRFIQLYEDFLERNPQFKR